MSSDLSVQRQNASFVAGLEKGVLIAIARRLPRSVTPDGLTAFGVLGAVIVLFGYAASNWNVNYIWLANIGIVIHWLGDSLDGTLARVRQIERPRFGFFIDQTVDVIGNLLIAVGLGLSPWVRLDVALLMLAAYHMLAIYALVYSLVEGKFRVDVAGLGPTEARLGMIFLNLSVYIFGAPLLGWTENYLTWYDVTLLGIFSALIILFLYELFTKAASLK
ncbi:CDP-alcohol phosphatidyltransferase family protein [Rhizobium sp. SL86]|uniref:CDP-alcohol phosphatidyltransferase family protein n=1 Tax=Rhizobium sp. SL86 TaxID=2995148 RepID=UPI0022769E52|nr:CDP-alcohol phosphatidyltransferase family protein [Rhizobium sp. SL86]MCY1669375.1 CDP-alcohol phosphatidyltransferase family protein [Rhizobium sp. SL86]